MQKGKKKYLTRDGILSKINCINVLRLDKFAKVIFDAIIDHKNQKNVIVGFCSEGDKELWWDKKITTIPPLKHNKPDIHCWNKHDSMCFIIDIAVGLDVNITKNINLKHDNYMQLSSELKLLYLISRSK